MTPAVVKWQIVTPQAEACGAFYATLFGWHINRDNALGYSQIPAGSERGIEGGIWPAPPDAPSFVQLFIEVPDVDACIAQATALGATVVVPKVALPDGDEMAVLRDPMGMTFGACRQR
ncbi:MAG: VOC family protein [Gemmatimonadetes bacterium]|nr:VOC family protein [Gemmatimonadota bacterium]